MTPPHPPAPGPDQGPDGILSRIEAAVTPAPDEVCACGCGKVLSPDGHSFYFLNEGCQKSWRAQQNAIAAGDHELADRLRAQQRETPEEREARHRAEVLADERRRQERAATREAISLWLRANAIDSNNVPEDSPIVTTSTRIRVTEHIRDATGMLIVRPDHIPSVEREYRLLVPWPDGLRYDHHHHEPDPEGAPAVDDGPPVQPRVPVALAVMCMGHNDPYDAVALPDDDPLVFRVRCESCGRRGAPYGETIEAFGEVQPIRGVRVCEHCAAHSPGLPFTATVTRSFELQALVLRLQAGPHKARWILHEWEMDHYPTAAGIWDVLVRLIRRREGQDQPGLDGATPVATVVDEIAELPEPSSAPTGRVMVAPVGTPADADGWQDLGTISGDGITIGFDGAARDGEPVMAFQGYHGRTIAMDISFRHQQYTDRWRRAWEQLFRQLGLAAWQMQQFTTAFGRPARNERNELMKRAIEAKKQRNTGPQSKRRAPRRIDPRHGR